MGSGTPKDFISYIHSNTKWPGMEADASPGIENGVCERVQGYGGCGNASRSSCDALDGSLGEVLVSAAFGEKKKAPAGSLHLQTAIRVQDAHLAIGQHYRGTRRREHEVRILDVISSLQLSLQISMEVDVDAATDAEGVSRKPDDFRPAIIKKSS